jgi:membrane-bound lytic murein transglycosylase D
MKAVRLWWLVILSVALSVPALRVNAVPNKELAESPHGGPLLPAPAGLRTQIDFWKDIFATYSTRQVVIHDALSLDRIYEVLDFSPLAENGFSDAEIAAYKNEKVESDIERVRATLMRLHRGGFDPSELSPEERRIWSLFAEVKESSRFLDAAAEDRIRSQTGLRERFAVGVEVSRRYLPRMEAIFRRAGLPLELTRLPLVESSFNIHAYSKAGAAGIWQFMPATARLYMRVTPRVDQRRDPIISTKAAAELLRTNYEVLGTWPLAITAYNHGRAGMVRAVEAVGSTDITDIIHHYHGPAFKFASRNFYAEFLAALEVERHFADYFGELPARQPDRLESAAASNDAGVGKLVGASAADSVQINPAVARQVVNGKVRSAKARRRTSTVRSAHPSKGAKHRGPRVAVVRHHVSRGQTLVAIAKHYGTTVAAIKRSNKLRRVSHLRPGQHLVIPTPS